MKVNSIIYEDFIQYKYPSMFIGFTKCTMKCGREYCQNTSLLTAPFLEIDANLLIDKFLKNPLTKAIVCGGLEPFDTPDDLKELVVAARKRCDNDIIIYSGYTKEELEDKEIYNFLKKYKNIIIKVGRYIPNKESHKDKLLGVMLSNDEQYAYKLEEDL